MIKSWLPQVREKIFFYGQGILILVRENGDFEKSRGKLTMVRKYLELWAWYLSNNNIQLSQFKKSSDLHSHVPNRLKQTFGKTRCQFLYLSINRYNWIKSLRQKLGKCLCFRKTSLFSWTCLCCIKLCETQIVVTDRTTRLSLV